MVIADGLFRYDFSVLVCDADMVFLISEVDADYRSVLFGFHRRTRSQTAGAASTLLIRSLLGMPTIL